MNTVPFAGHSGGSWRIEHHYPEGTPFAAGDHSNHPCCDCGWPIKSTALKAGRTETGERLYRHVLCPSLKQRAALRAEALQPTH